MRSALTVLCLAYLATGCSTSRQARLTEAEVVQSAQSASILGTWVLVNVAETQFVGANRVELQLSPGAFRLQARYLGAPTLVVDGEASFDPNGGQLTLTPRSNTRVTSGAEAPLLPVGQPIVMLATAADNTMVFAEPGETVQMPTSVWHRAEAVRPLPVDARVSEQDSLRRP